jgi:dUTP pyrophosphatase
MKIQIKRIDKSLPLPKYQTFGAVAFDLVSRIDVEIKPLKVNLIPLNVIIKIPKNHAMLLVPRSSLPIKKGLLIPNGIGIIDQDFCGPKDELHLEVLNFTNKKVKIKKGERIAQGLLVAIKKVKWLEVKKINQRSRGGFGSTG